MKTVWIKQQFVVTDKTEARMYHVKKLNYRFNCMLMGGTGPESGTVMVVCERTWGEPKVIASKTCEVSPIEDVLTEVVNRAYEILYGEENDEDYT
jgi:hypothetical protein